jgi:hypothetical protein
MLASVATHGPRSNVAPAALSELKNACDLFEAASGYGGRAIKFLVNVHSYKNVIKLDMQFILFYSILQAYPQTLTN